MSQLKLTFLLFILSLKLNAQDNNIGSIQYDSLTDDKNFKVCKVYKNGIPQYYEVGTSYEGGLKSIKEHFSKSFHLTTIHKNQTGYLTIRFIVNCEGQTGWYRFMETDLDFNRYTFDPALKTEVLAITKTLNKWKPGYYEYKPCDSYKFLIFKIVNGKIEDILP